MAKITIVFGLLLILLGIFGYVGTGSHAPTALIPAYFGLGLIVFGILANTPDAKRRMLFMHIAVTIGLVGFLGTVKSIFDFVRLEQGHPYLHPLAVQAKAAMSVMLLFYVLLCVRSFINARRVRV
jgi:hypothetical protein